MDRVQFDKHADEFFAYINYLANTARDGIQQAKDALDKPTSIGPSPSSDAELCIRSLAERIEDLMAVHDKLHTSLGMAVTFESWFRIRSLPPDQYRKVLAIVDAHSTNAP